ncbi:MAG: hypothetical protein JW854_13255 [Actinobacteria bacterium]|nr:hypothetical protein [Actinomycetota bacterium]
MRIKKCKVCGFPYWLGKELIWSGNGTITSKNRPDFRTLIIEADYLSEIFRKIEEALGISIQHIVFEAQRNAAKEVIDGNIGKYRWVIRHIPGVRRLVITYFNRMASWTGQGYAKTVAYTSKGPGAAIIRNPFNKDLMSAVVVGALESLGETPYDYRWEKRGADDVIVVEPTGERPEISQRLTFTVPPPKPGSRHYDRCPGCGVPVQLKGMEWTEEQGLMMDTSHNVRMVVLEIYTTSVVLRELARELGDDVYPVIVDAQRQFSLAHIRKEFPSCAEPGGGLDRDAFYRDVLDSLALRGQGNPVSWNMEGGRLTVTVDNPFEEHILAGHLSALYELAEGGKPEVSWESPSPSTVTFTLQA